MKQAGPSRISRKWPAAVASLVPWIGFLLTSCAADFWIDDHSAISATHVLAVSPAYLGIVALPSLVPILAAPRGWLRVTVVVAMTVVAAVAALAVAASDDAQAGLAVLLVPYVALPLGAALLVGRAIWKRLR